MTTCFFCQSLLSDFIEGFLPHHRQEEIKQHIEGCSICREMEKDLNQAIKMLGKVEGPALSGNLTQNTLIAIQKGSIPFFNKERVSRWGLLSMIPILLITMLSVVFPNAFPLINTIRNIGNEAQFVRYYPLHQGALEVVEEQSTLLHSKEPFTGSLWEEGGLSPEDFEKAFQKKGVKGAESEVLLEPESEQKQ